MLVPVWPVVQWGLYVETTKNIALLYLLQEKLVGFLETRKIQAKQMKTSILEKRFVRLLDTCVILLPPYNLIPNILSVSYKDFVFCSSTIVVVVCVGVSLALISGQFLTTELLLAGYFWVEDHS